MQNNDTFRIIWDGDSQTDCVEICRELKRAGIVYRVAQQPVSRSIGMRVHYEFQVGVLDCDYESARAALGLSAAADNNVEDQAFEIPESIGRVNKSSQPENESMAAGSYLKPWHPENATVEIWSQVAMDTIVTMALRENLIHYRLQRAENGAYTLAHGNDAGSLHARQCKCTEGRCELARRSIVPKCSQVRRKWKHSAGRTSTASVS